MNKATKIYASAISIAGIAIGLVSCVCFFRDFGAEDVSEIVFLSVYLVLCRCLPLHVGNNVSIEFSFISVVTIILLRGPATAAALYLLTSVFVFDPQSDGRYVSILKGPPIKTCFNIANVVLTIAISGQFYFLAGGVPGNVELPDCIIPLFVCVGASMLANSFFMSLLQRFISGEKISKSLVMGFAQFLPSIFSAVPIGYYIATLLRSPNGFYTAALFVLPLLLARYGFKLYINSKQQAYSTIEALIAAVESKDHYTEGHSMRVAAISEQIARQLKLSGKTISVIKSAAVLHDIGKIGVSDLVLNKPGPLTAEETEEIKVHPEKSRRIVANIHFYGDIQPLILYHHERYDGRGYPAGLAGDNIPFGSAIIAVADAFDAMTTDRPYRRGFSFEHAANVIKEESGRQFNPEAAAALLELYQAGELR